MNLRLKGLRFCTAYAVALLTYTLSSFNTTLATDGPIRSLSDAENSAVIGGTVGLGIIAKLIPNKHVDTSKFSSYEANAIDRWWRTTIRGGSGQKTNFLDNHAGSFIAPVAGTLVMTAIDINRREFSRDIPFFVAGALTTGAVTDISKRVFNRPRPYCQSGGVRPPDRRADDSYHLESFFSGHSSQAFFAAGFVNNRVRRHMRQEWRRDEYRSWRWASPLLTYGWATFVAGSRIHADKHHFTDVLTGAAVGYGLSELFYRLCYEPGQTSSESVSNHQMFALTLTF